MGKKVLLVGDSITAGISGYSYVKLLKQECPDFRFKNLGRGGDTLRGTLTRMFCELSRSDDFDGIVIEAGINDIIIPQMNRMGFLYRMLGRVLIARGSVPAEDARSFALELQEGMRRLSATYRGRVILMTLSCIGEDLDSDLNQKRQKLNHIIREEAVARKFVLADVGRAFDSHLGQRRGGASFLGNILAQLLEDPICSSSKVGVEWLSKKRRMVLTIDGVHLSYRGALIYKDAIRGALV